MAVSLLMVYLKTGDRETEKKMDTQFTHTHLYLVCSVLHLSLHVLFFLTSFLWKELRQMMSPSSL